MGPWKCTVPVSFCMCLSSQFSIAYSVVLGQLRPFEDFSWSTFFLVDPKVFNFKLEGFRVESHTNMSRRGACLDGCLFGLDAGCQYYPRQTHHTESVVDGWCHELKDNYMISGIADLGNEKVVTIKLPPLAMHDMPCTYAYMIHMICM
jgi:hypothetical protein